MILPVDLRFFTVFCRISFPSFQTKSTEFNPTISCHNPSECLSTIERDTFTPTPGCASLPTADFARKTWAVFALRCPGYSRVQINSLQEVKKGEDTTNNCLEKASHLLGLWRRFSRISEE
nr:thymic stromal lymphopoietin [Oryctolagus cuniculus]